MKTRYISKCREIGLEYIDGVLNQVFTFTKDRISWDALRHDIEFYEDELDLNDWIQC